VKKIYVFMDLDIIEPYPGNRIFPIAHDSVIREMRKGADVIYTHDPSFFQFDALNDGYDVIVLRGGDGVVLSELLDREAREKYGIEKEIRWGNNAYKMLMAGGLPMIPMTFEIPPPGRPSIEVVKAPVRYV
jgi:hypothetical protein